MAPLSSRLSLSTGLHPKSLNFIGSGLEPHQVIVLLPQHSVLPASSGAPGSWITIFHVTCHENHLYAGDWTCETFCTQMSSLTLSYNPSALMLLQLTKSS